MSALFHAQNAIQPLPPLKNRKPNPAQAARQMQEKGVFREIGGKKKKLAWGIDFLEKRWFNGVYPLRDPAWRCDFFGVPPHTKGAEGERQ